MKFIMLSLTVFLSAAIAGYAANAQPNPVARFESGKIVAVFDSFDKSSAPPIKATLGTIRTHTCNHAFDLPAAKSEIRDNLRMRAMALGGNGVIDVSYAPFTYNHKSPCRMGLSGEGTAVLFAAPEARQ